MISQHGADRPAAVFAACNRRAQCGACVPSLCALLGLGRTCSRGAAVPAGAVPALLPALARQAAAAEAMHAA